MVYAIKGRSIRSYKWKKSHMDPLVAVSDKYIVEVLYRRGIANLDNSRDIDVAVTDLINNTKIFSFNVGEYMYAIITQPFIEDDIAVFQIDISANNTRTYLVDINKQSDSVININGRVIGLFDNIIYYTQNNVLNLYNVIDKTISDYGDIYLTDKLYKLGNDLVYTATDFVDENGEPNRVLPFSKLRFMIYIIDLQSDSIIYEMDGKDFITDIVGNKIICGNGMKYYITDFSGDTEVINFIGEDDEIIDFSIGFPTDYIVATYAGSNYISMWIMIESNDDHKHRGKKYSAYLTEFVLRFNSVKSTNSLIYN